MPTVEEFKYDDPAIINIEDTGTALHMFDKLTRIGEGRRVMPFDQYDNVVYLHRGYYSNYNLQIGDTCFMIPPEFIMVNSESTSQSMVTLRQENTVKERSGFHKRTILIDLVFNGLNQINGFPVKGPEGIYYVDGLRQLLAQFKCTPFLPITNELINGMYGIFTVVLQSITMSTIPGFPNLMAAQITLQEVDMFPYIEMPNVCFERMIDWDLFRFYYQSFLTETNEYRKLQSLHTNKEHNRFKISLLDEAVFNSGDANEYNILELICDQKILDESKGTNYTLWLDSDTSDVVISSFQCGYSNLLTNIQLSDCSCPTVQFMGGMDTIYNIQFETTDYSVVQALEACRIANDAMTRDNAKLHSLGFVKLESELVAFTGSLFVMIESVTTNTVPGFPNLYNVQINCVAYDIAQSKREELHGFRPFECDDCKETDESNDYKDDLYPDHVHEDQAIDQTMAGLEKKIKQDNYAEWKLRTEIEVYPDLRLPTYAEVNEFIKKCNKFRKENDLGELSYSEYPVRPECMLHGNNPNNKIDLPKGDNGIIEPKDINTTGLEYNVFVDPDFYVFYPWSYKSFEAEEGIDGAWYDCYKNKTRDGYTKTFSRETYPLSHGEYDTNVSGGSNTGYNSNSSLIEQFMSVLEDQLGCTYKMVNEADGRLKDSNGRYIFDCSGLITFALRQIGVMTADSTRLIVKDIADGKHENIFREVTWGDKKRGDVLLRYGGGSHHVVVYKGDDLIIHASSDKGKVETRSNYFNSNDRVFRVKAFETTVSSTTDGSGVIDVSGTGQDAVWSALKAYGLTDIACAGIMGNMIAESGINSYNVQGSWKKDNPDEYNQNYVSKVDSGEISKDDFINNGPGGGGFGLVQFTYSAYKKELYELAKSSGKSIADVGVQVTVFINQIKSMGVFDKLNAATSIQDASNIMLLEYERPADQSTKVQNKRADYAKSIYSQYAGTDVGSANVAITGPTLTTGELDSICRTIMMEIEGTNDDNLIVAMAQVIYDRLTSAKYGGLGNILNDKSQFKGLATGAISESIKSIVTSVFCENKKYWSDYCAYSFLYYDSNSSSFDINDDKFTRIGDVSVFTFWGENKSGSGTKYTIVSASGTGSASTNNQFFNEDVTYEAVTIDTDVFAEPVLVRTDAIVYDDSWKIWVGADHKENAKKHLNHSRRIFGSSFVDEAQYSCRGRLVRAFPAYLFCLLDDQSQWYDGRKLWTNYYVTKSVVDIAVHETNDMPTATATITVSNLYRNLSRTQGGLSSYYSVKNDLAWYQTWWYNLTGQVIDLGSPNLTDKMIQLRQVIYNQAKLREGARVHLRMGYGSDPLSLAPMINGTVSDVTVGDQITMVVTSDGVELTQHITSANEKDTNKGWFGLFGFGEEQEPSNIIAHIMCKRQNWFNYIVGGWFEGSKYSIEHFGLYFNQSIMQYLGNFISRPLDNITDTFENTSDAVEDLTGSDLAGDIVGGLAALVTSPFSILSGLASNITSTVADIWNEYQEQYDLLKNIYKADYGREHYIYTNIIFDGEKNVVFNQYNMTPWDVFQICTQSCPEYIVKPSYHQFDSRLYFGLPFWMEKYRYNYLNGKVYEECKSASQMHLVDSLTTIIDNQVRVTNRYSSTNVKVMYTRGSDPTSTQTIHSDDTIDYSKQKTTIIDSSVTQDALGPDALYEFLGYDVGEQSARRIGISNLLYGWQQQYQGQIICLGIPGVKAHDYFMLYDTYVNMYGLAIVREVVHSFGINTGFTTSITPGMIGFSTDGQSGMVEVCKNYLNLLNHFSSFLYTRHEMKNNYEKNLKLFSNMKLAEDQVKSMMFQKAWDNGVINISNALILGTNVLGAYANKEWLVAGGSKIVNGAKSLKQYESLKDMGAGIIKAVKTTFSSEKMTNVCNAFYDAYKAGMNADKATDAVKAIKAIKNINNFFGAIGKGSIAAVTTIFPGGALMRAAIWLIIDVLLGEFVEWVTNRNVCCLLPLWWENTTFVSGVSGGTKILLCDSANTPTTEQEESKTKNGGDIIENPSEDNDGY